MSLRPVEQSMAVTRPVDSVADKARELRQTGLNAAVMQHDENVDTERELKRTNATKNVEDAKIHEEEQRKNGQKEQEQDEQQPETIYISRKDIQKELERRANERLMNLPVERGKYAQREYHYFDTKA